MEYKVKVRDLVDLIVANLPENQSHLKTKLSRSFEEFFVGYPSEESIYDQAMRNTLRELEVSRMDRVCYLVKEAVRLIFLGGTSGHSDEPLIKSLTSAEEVFSQQYRYALRDKVRGIYVIVDPEATDGRSAIELVQCALEAGVSIIQYRDKRNDRSAFLEQSYRIRALCWTYQALFVVNDAVDVARLVGADFLHVGQSDLPVQEARKLLDKKQGIGRSNDGLQESAKSQFDGSDYLAVGAVYATSTMGKSGRIPVGPDTVALVKKSVDLPVVAIGGINETNLSEVRDSGADSACVVSAITMSDNPEAAARRLVAIWDQG